MQQQPEMKEELRLALGMRGGVSLAVWIGGACAEIDELRRAVDTREGFWWEVLDRSPYSRVVVDVMAGASAGGLNGVLFATAIRHGFKMADLLPVWQKVASVDRLRRNTDPYISLFDGDEDFLDVIRDALGDLIEHGDPAVARRERNDGYVDLQLSATLVEPIDQGAISPGDEPLRSSRSTARFHFRHDPNAALPALDLELGGLARLAVAARATASFPIAFEAAAVRSNRPRRFRLTRPPTPRAAASNAEERLVDCHGVFSESRGRVDKADSGRFVASDFVVADGGIVDNIPLAKAIDGARGAPADRVTRRVLVYLHPTGPAGGGGGTEAAPVVDDVAEEVRRRGPLSVLTGLVASRVQGESIDLDLERLESQNRAVRMAEALRMAALAEVEESAVGLVELAASRLGGYVIQRAGADAQSIGELLLDPLGTLGEDPFPLAPDEAPHPDDRWRSPLSGWTGDQRLQLDNALLAAFNVALGSDGIHQIAHAGLGPIARSVSLVLDLVRAAERDQPDDADQLGAIKVRLYRLGSLVEELQRARRLGWVAAAGTLRADDLDITPWLVITRRRLNRLLRCDRALAVAMCDSSGSAASRQALRTYLDRTAQGLQAIAKNEEPETARAGVRTAVVAELDVLVGELLEVMDRRSGDIADERRGTHLIHLALLQEAPLATRLGALDVLLLQEHLLDAPGGSEISFVRMSAAAPIIDAERFKELHAASKALDERFTSDGDHLAPDVKLAGNELASFSAFLKEEWRTNDWMWGRIDAVPTLVDLLLGEDRPEDERRDLGVLAGVVDAEVVGQGRRATRRELIRKRQDEIFEQTVGQERARQGDAGAADLEEARARWQVGLETLTGPGSVELSRSVSDLAVVAAQVVGRQLPRQVPRIAGQLQSLASAAGRRFAKPTGELPPLPGEEPEPVPTRRAKDYMKGLALPISAAVAGFVVAAVLWAFANDTPSLGIGLGVGLLVSLVPSIVLLVLATMRVPEGAESRWGFAGAVVLGLFLGGAVTGVATTIWWGITT